MYAYIYTYISMHIAVLQTNKYIFAYTKGRNAENVYLAV